MCAMYITHLIQCRQIRFRLVTLCKIHVRMMKRETGIKGENKLGKISEIDN